MIYLFLFLIGLQFHSYHFTRPHDNQEHKTRVDLWTKIIPYNADFAFHMYREISSTLSDKNILFSPLSISTAFAMLSFGATSEFRHRIYSGLTFNLSEIEENEIHQGFCQLIHKLNLPRERTHIHIGNALFFEKSLEVRSSFLESVRNIYLAEDFFTDFLNPTRAKQQINNYINSRTYGKRVNTFKDLSEHTRMVLVNYVIFKADWKDRFHHRLTSESDFLAYGNITVKVNMMQRRASYRFLHDEDLSCTVVEMPYPENVVAWVILPDEGKLKDVESSLVKEDLNKWRTSFEYRDVELQIPKFSISASNDIIDLLQKVGVTNADLSGITNKHNLRVSQALHEAVLVVDEDDTVAISAGSPGIRTFYRLPFLLPPPAPSPPPLPPPPPLIKFNRPFLMAIIDTSTGTILLMGKIVNPTQE
ncbi:serpin A3-3-like [Heteronotia binoei]|uniref:serpin A3-3-like n=1 Tax=Heteronotia binoei TaxID=13085 RepID=UPI00292FB0F1|nr:serpin A3-3-like [Heteronotia binoei]XP_060117109.1 serpin A3-3-like [Heteronotia binoei]XP_060117110.1 serpin A3-3-like [Heteronotia binoei]